MIWRILVFLFGMITPTHWSSPTPWRDMSFKALRSFWILQGCFDAKVYTARNQFCYFIILIFLHFATLYSIVAIYHTSIK